MEHRSCFRLHWTNRGLTIIDFDSDSLTETDADDSTKSPKKSGSKKKPEPELTEEEKQELSERANQIREQQAENQLELAKLFLENEKPDIALRRLKEIVTEYSGSKAAKEAKSLMKKL